MSKLKKKSEPLKVKRFTKEWFKSNVYETLFLLFVISLITYGAVVTIKADKEVHITPYYDDVLNYTFNYPNDYDIHVPSPAKKLQTVMKLTTGMNFDMSKYALKEELLSVALKSTDSKTNNSKIMTVAFYKPVNEDFSDLSDRGAQLDEMKELLKGVKGNNVEIKYVKEIKTKGTDGVEAKGVTEIQGEDMVFYQYREPIGKNVMLITYSSNLNDDQYRKDLETILTDLKFYNIEGINENYMDTVDENGKVTEENVIDKEAEKETKDEKELEKEQKTK